MGHPGGVASLDIPCKNNSFEISINYSGAQINIEADCLLGLDSNHIRFDIRDKSRGHYSPYTKSANNFEKLSLHMTLKCNNKECHHHYVICSKPLTCIPNKQEHPVFEIAPFQLYMESFVIEGSWIQNLWIEDVTCIYSVKNHDDEPIEIPIIDWSKLDPNKIRNKVKTLVTFS